MKRCFLIISLGLALSCTEQEELLQESVSYEAVQTTFENSIDLNSLPDYEGQEIPNYITKDNTVNNPVTNEGAILGRVLFYDKNLSVDNTISCSSCHQQSKAFGDSELVSTGVNGETGRHSMRLINSRFSDETQFFWDERAQTLEIQTTLPIQDHNEMGFSGENGDPDLDDLIAKLQSIDYYQELFDFAYGDEEVTQVRIQNALAQFIRSIQSFDSKFDQGRAEVNNITTDFSNFTTEENLGKRLFLDPPGAGGAGCAGCHRPPEFDIDPSSRNNGVIGLIGENGQDLTNTRSPSLRDLFDPGGELNGPLMHDGSFNSLLDVVNHYNLIDEPNQNLDPRLRGQNLNLSDEEKEALVAFVKTLSGTAVYTDERWSDPF